MFFLRKRSVVSVCSHYLMADLERRSRTDAGPDAMIKALCEDVSRVMRSILADVAAGDPSGVAIGSAGNGIVVAAGRFVLGQKYWMAEPEDTETAYTPLECAGTCFSIEHPTMAKADTARIAFQVALPDSCLGMSLLPYSLWERV